MSGIPGEEFSCEVCADENPHFAAGDRWMLADKNKGPAPK